MQYLSGVPQYGSHLKWILVFSLSMGGGALDRYYVRVLSQHKRNPPVVCRRVNICQLEYAYCSRIVCTSSLSFGRWFITMLQRISAV